MAEILLIHHVAGLTEGVLALADRLRGAGHRVHSPDLYGGATFDSVEAGFAHAQSLGAEAVEAALEEAMADLPDELVHMGISWGVMRAQRLAQTRPGARAAILLEACVPITGEWAFGPWPDGVPVQVHGKDDDEFFAHEGDLDAAREIAATVPDAAVFTYPGSEHLFVDSSLPSYDEEATELVLQRVLDLLDRV